MWFLNLVPAAPLITCGVLVAQGMQLADRVERPLFYLAQRAPETGGEDVLSSLNDDVLLAALGLKPAANRDVKEVDAGGAVLQSVQRLLSRLSHFSEASAMALVGMMPLGPDRPERPLLVFHTQLRESGVAAMRELLENGDLAAPRRVLHDRQVYALQAGSDELGSVEVALVDRDLVVSNDARTMGRMLDTRTLAGGGLANDPRFARLRAKTELPPGSLLCYADWRALRPRLSRLWQGEVSWLMAFSGIGQPAQIMFVARPAPRRSGQTPGILTSVLIDHTAAPRELQVAVKPSALKTMPAPKKTADRAPDGLVDVLKPARIKDLLSGLPLGGGLVTIGTNLDLKKVLPTHSGPKMRRLQARVFRAARLAGIDLRRDVLRRLSSLGGAQILVLPQSGGPGLRLAWSVRAKSTKAAKELFEDVRKSLVPSGLAKLHTIPGAARQAELRVRIPLVSDSIVLARVQDALVLAFDPQVTEQVRTMTAAERKVRSSHRRATLLAKRLQRLDIDRQQKLAGVFGLDLGCLVEGTAGDSNDPQSGLLGLHGGYFEFEKNLVRLEMFTELDES